MLHTFSTVMGNKILQIYHLFLLNIFLKVCYFFKELHTFFDTSENILRKKTCQISTANSLFALLPSEDIGMWTQHKTWCKESLHWLAYGSVTTDAKCISRTKVLTDANKKYLNSLVLELCSGFVTYPELSWARNYTVCLLKNKFLRLYAGIHCMTIWWNSTWHKQGSFWEQKSYSANTSK